MRVFEERATFIFKKLYLLEPRKKEFFESLRKEVSKFSYQTSKDLLIEYYSLVLKEEQPLVNNFRSLIMNHTIRIKKNIQNNPYIARALVEDVEMLLSYYATLRHILERRVQEVKDEVNLLSKLVNGGIDLKLLEELEKIERRDESIDMEISALRSKVAKITYSLIGNMGLMLEKVFKKISQLNDKSGLKKKRELLEKEYEDAFASLQANMGGIDIVIDIILTTTSIARTIRGKNKMTDSIADFFGYTGEYKKIMSILKKYDEAKKAAEKIAKNTSFKLYVKSKKLTNDLVHVAFKD